MYIVNIYYSFDESSPAVIFDTESEAKKYIREDITKENDIAEENDSPVSKVSISNEGEWARIDFEDDNFMEWTIAEIHDKRETHERARIRNAYLAIMELLENDPRECMTDEDAVGEMYAEAANFANAVQNLGYDF